MPDDLQALISEKYKIGFIRIGFLKLLEEIRALPTTDPKDNR